MHGTRSVSQVAGPPEAWLWRYYQDRGRLAWAFRENRIAVRFAYEWHDDSGNWFRSYGNELWEFAPSGLMQRREASINDQPISESDRRIRV